jgi:methylated-DNA-[protein]-cysteine S-methyltransferase
MMKFTQSITQKTIASPLGDMLLASSVQGLVGLWFVHDQKHMPDGFGTWPVGESPVLQKAAQQIHEYFAGQRTTFDLPLDLSAGTAFQQSVWRGLLGIQSGHSTSYGALAQRIGNAAAVRAVGAAVGRNPISIIVPCHRVLGADGSLTGYAGGLDRKTALLQLEGVLI